MKAGLIDAPRQMPEAASVGGSSFALAADGMDFPTVGLLIYILYLLF